MLLVVALVAVLAAGVVLTLGYWHQRDRARCRTAETVRHRRELEAADAGDRLFEDLVAQRVVVSLNNGDGFAGVLVDRDARSLKLADAVGVSAKGERATVDGITLVPRAEVRYVQRPAG